MNFLFLSPHFPPQYQLFCAALSRNGISVLGIADAAYEDLLPELRASLTEYFKVGNMEDYEEVYRACGYLIHHHGRIDRAESHNEHWLELEGRLREDFNIPGPKNEATMNIKRKSLMKRIFANAGVGVGKGALLSDRESALDFIRQVGYPIIAKPDIGVGGWATYKISSPSELEDFFRTRPPVEFFLDEYIDGELYTFDGITNREGEPVFVTSHYSRTGVFELVAYNDDLNYYSLRQIPEDLMDFGLKSVKAFNIREKFFHFEFFRRKSDGKLFALELNCRPPGGFSTDMMNFSCDIDVYQEWANIVAFNRFSATIERKYHCAHVARRDGKRYRLPHEEVMNRYGDRIAFHSEVKPIFSAVMGNYAYLVRTPDLVELKRIIGEIQEQA